MRKRILLLFFLASMVLFYSCQLDLNRDQVDSKSTEPIETSHNPELERNKKSSEREKTESENLESDIELVSPNIEKTVYLTFDDGPTSVTTDILDALHQFNAEATFFMLEPLMRDMPEVVTKIVEAGHAVGLHGVTHNKEHFYQSEQSALEEMMTAQKTLQQITGIRSNLIRTPYGSVPYLTNSFRDILDSRGFKLWDWNVDSSDWSLSSGQYVETVINQIENLVKADVAPIILMHDKQKTAEHLPILLTYLSDQGYQMKRMEENMLPYNFNCYTRCHRLTVQK
ncbi:peptidoglycan/xylan/chitin deacetylase (PgdA/CDA1 family) [Cytobacillus eiseniae]|uniref:Peptidoglycan/xylan/chitin deacetylase (PgdA/CDA1 family) n=1 Tax=Cytobacillus eiseniae TaxID=762947 RepID=A0ABS4RIN2_9BACI|nr:polysaccharide deacetylase family protein [Cytobacillus eiseniae]MBP2242618.1 peptidoglycan/xylan/chitin deacetylase (PgdA/CDA1 family) [Cytobacillus eiseniae]